MPFESSTDATMLAPWAWQAARAAAHPSRSSNDRLTLGPRRALTTHMNDADRANERPAARRRRSQGNEEGAHPGETNYHESGRQGQVVAVCDRSRPATLPEARPCPVLASGLTHCPHAGSNPCTFARLSTHGAQANLPPSAEGRRGRPEESMTRVLEPQRALRNEVYLWIKQPCRYAVCSAIQKSPAA